MTYIVKRIRSFFVVLFCLMAINIAAHEPQASKRFFIPIPKSSRVSKKENNNITVFGFLSFAGFKSMLDRMHLLNIGERFNNIDMSGVKQVIQDNQQMLMIVTGTMGFLLLMKRAQKSKTWGPWCTEKYAAITKKINDTYELLPEDIKGILWLCKRPASLLYSLIAKYICLNEGIIVSSVTSPITGKLLDCGLVCPIPFVNFTAIGSFLGVIIAVKGYFDQSFEEIKNNLNEVKLGVQQVDKKIDNLDEKNNEQHNKTQQEMQQGFEGVNNHIESVDIKVKNLSLSLGEVNEQIKGIDGKVSSVDTKVINCFNQLQSITKEIQLLPEQINEKNKEELEVIKKSLNQIDNVQGDQVKTLQQVQENIGVLLDNRDSDEKKITELLDGVVTSNIALKQLQKKSDEQETALQEVFKNVQNNIAKNKEELLQAIGVSVEQCSSLAKKMTQLEQKVDNNHEALQNQFQQIEVTVDNHHKASHNMLKKLLEQNENLKKQLEDQNKENAEKEKKYQQMFDSLKQDLAGTAEVLQGTQKEILKEVKRSNKKKQLEHKNSSQSYIENNKQQPKSIDYPKNSKNIPTGAKVCYMPHLFEEQDSESSDQQSLEKLLDSRKIVSRTNTKNSNNY